MNQPEVVRKPKSITQRLADLQIDEFLDFPFDSEDSIRAMISGTNRGGLREKYPLRKYRTDKVQVPEDLVKILQATELLRVTRKA